MYTSRQCIMFSHKLINQHSKPRVLSVHWMVVPHYLCQNSIFMWTNILSKPQAGVTSQESFYLNLHVDPTPAFLYKSMKVCIDVFFSLIFKASSKTFYCYGAGGFLQGQLQTYTQACLDKP